jgi:hypothetical protein
MVHDEIDREPILRLFCCGPHFVRAERINYANVSSFLQGKWLGSALPLDMGGGFAAGASPLWFWLRPSGTFDKRSEPKQGHSPVINWFLRAGHSHRRTSGGKAEPNVACHFLRQI